MSKLIVVVGATGQQGGSVVASLFANSQLSSEYNIRGTTRDAKSEKALSLQRQGVEMVEADLEDHESLKRAFSGAHVVFANTVTIYDGHAYDHEVEHGKALADAAVAAGVPFYIYSTLPNAGKISGGKLKNMGHFDGKEVVEQYIRGLPLKSAFIAPGSFMSNFHASMKPHATGDANGTFVWAGPVSPETKLPLLATEIDTGKWVMSILEQFDKFEGKVVPCATSLYTMDECARVMSHASGKRVVYQQIPEEKFRQFLPPTMASHITEMLVYFQDYGYYGEGTAEKVNEGASNAAGKLTTLEEYFQQRPLILA